MRRTRRRCRRGRPSPRPRRSPSVSHTTVSAPYARRSASSISARLRPGLRFGFSRQRSVVTTSPAPSTTTAPPSPAMPTSYEGTPRWRRASPRSSASRSNGVNEPPQPVKRKQRAWRDPSGAAATTGPESRSHESSIGSARTSMFPFSRCGAAPSASVGSATSSTGSKRGDRVGDERVDVAGGVELVAPQLAARARRSATRSASARAGWSPQARVPRPAGTRAAPRRPWALPACRESTTLPARRGGTEEDADEPRTRLGAGPGPGVTRVRAGVARPLLRPRLRRGDPHPELGVLARGQRDRGDVVRRGVRLDLVGLARDDDAREPVPDRRRRPPAAHARADVPGRARRDRRGRRRQRPSGVRLALLRAPDGHGRADLRTGEPAGTEKASFARRRAVEYAVAAAVFGIAGFLPESPRSHCGESASR